jgi:hypothetical protein
MEPENDNRNPDDFDEVEMTFSGAMAAYAFIMCVIVMTGLSLYLWLRA